MEGLSAAILRRLLPHPKSKWRRFKDTAGEFTEQPLTNVRKIIAQDHACIASELGTAYSSYER